MHTRAQCLQTAILGLIMVGCSTDDEGGGGFQMPPTPVETATVGAEGVVDRFSAVGTIEASEAITVAAEINGRVVQLPFREGDEIAAGDLIAQLDSSELVAQVARAEAELDQRRSSFERVQLVVERNLAAAQDFDDAAAALRVGEANLALARARLAKTQIVAPFEGAVGARRVSPGAFLRAGDPITELAAIRQIKIVFTAPERYVSRLHRGARVSVETTAFPGMMLEGVIDVVEPMLDPGTRSVRVIARAANPESRFRPGMSANVTAVLDERPHALTIPNEAVFARGNQMLVYVVLPDSTVTETPVVLGTREATFVEVVDGLEPGMHVVRAGHQKLREGARVMPVASTEEATVDELAGPTGETE